MDGPLPNFRDRLPLEVVRDLLGITRAMFLAARKDVELTHQLDERDAARGVHGGDGGSRRSVRDGALVTERS